jgi:DNA polymerase
MSADRLGTRTPSGIGELVDRLNDHVRYARAMGVRDAPVRARTPPAPRVAAELPAHNQPPAPSEPAGLLPSLAQQPPHPDPVGALTRLKTDTIGDCRRCALAPTRTQIVFGVGSPTADLVFVGEAPGADEDAQGVPFVGKAGQLLTKIIEAMGLRRDDVYIANIIKCRPPGNRNPHPDEIAACEPFLIAQLDIIRPRVICCLGTFAAQTLLTTKDPISRLRGRWHVYQGIKLMPTFHPAYLLRNPAEKKTVWADIQRVMTELGLPEPTRTAGSATV